MHMTGELNWKCRGLFFAAVTLTLTLLKRKCMPCVYEAVSCG